MKTNKINIPLLVFRILALALALFGMGYRFLDPLFTKNFWHSLDMLGYFTIQSGLMLCLLFILLIIGQLKHKSNSSVNPGFRGAVLLYIIITTLVFLMILDKSIESTGINSFILYINHSLTAVLLCLDSFFTIPPKSFEWKHIYIWLIYPLSYFAFSMLEGCFFCRFRYFFLNYHEFGIISFIIMILLLILSFIGLSAIIIYINRYTKTKLFNEKT